MADHGKHKGSKAAKAKKLAKAFALATPAGAAYKGVKAIKRAVKGKRPSTAKRAGITPRPTKIGPKKMVKITRKKK